MKSLIVLLALLFLFSGCAGMDMFSPSTFEKMESCVECADGLQEFTNMRTLKPSEDVSK